MTYRLLIVCPREFQAACGKYARFKRSMGISCLVHPIERCKERLANSRFLEDHKIDPAYLDEPAACLKIDLFRYYQLTRTRYVLLAGDVDRIPVPWFEFMQGGKRYFYPADLYYADLHKTRPGPELRPAFQTWDPDRDSVKGEFRADQIAAIDFFPDLAVGRIPASSVTELETAFARLMARQAPSNVRCLFLRGNAEGNTPWLEQVSKHAADLLREPGYDVSLKSLSIAPDADSNTAQSTLDSVHSYLAQGVDYIFWFGHGGPNSWGGFGPHSFQFPEEVPKIKGSPIVFSMSCNVGQYTDSVYGTQYFSGGNLTTPIPSGSSTVPVVPDALQPPPSAMEKDYGPEEWLVKHEHGATALIAGHSWGTFGGDFPGYLGTQPLDFISNLNTKMAHLPTPSYLGIAFNNMIIQYLRKYKQNLQSDGAALNHLLRIHLFGDPTTPLFF
jgi:hypothetical protein